MMTAALKRLPTPQDYLAIERTARERHEYHFGHIIAMAGGTTNHNRIKENLVIELGVRLKGGPCQSFSSDQRLRVSADQYVYPDIMIVCDELLFAAEDADTLTNPRVILEVLSDSTERHDRRRKFDGYASLASLREYILVSQHEPWIERLVRSDDGGWRFHVFSGLTATFELATLPIRVPMNDIYLGVTFPTMDGSTSRHVE